jgi:methionyl-tRNA formyltransferase
LKVWQVEVLDGTGIPGEILHIDKLGIVVGCGQGTVRILRLQREGGRQLAASEFLGGHPLKVGQKLGRTGDSSGSNRGETILSKP